MVQEVTFSSQTCKHSNIKADKQTNKQTNLQGIYFIKGLTPFSTANTPQYEFFEFFVGMDQWWISVQPSSSCKSSTWSSAPQMCSGVQRRQIFNEFSSWFFHLGKQVEILCGSSWFDVFFNERNSKPYCYPFVLGSSTIHEMDFFFEKDKLDILSFGKTVLWWSCAPFFTMFHAILNESIISHHRSGFLFSQVFHLTILFVSFSCVDSRYP